MINWRKAPQIVVDYVVSAVAGYQATSGKDTSGGYAGLTLFKINFKNAANTVTSFFTNANTAARTYTFKDYDCTIPGVVSDSLILKSTEAAGIMVDETNPAHSWSDLRGNYVVDTTGASAPTIETFDTGITRLGFNGSDICRTEFHIEHRDLTGGTKYLHPHIQIARGATAATTNLVLTHVIKHTYSSIGAGETRGTSPVPITVTQTITPTEINDIGSGNSKPFDIEFANTGGTGGKLNSTNFFADDLIEVTTIVTTIPSVTGGTSAKVAITPIDIHREVRDGSGTKNKDRSGGSFYGTT